MQIKNLYRWIRVLIIRLFALTRSKEYSDTPDSLLIIAPHPDDETFGCSGLIQRAIKEKKKVKILILTGGEGAYDTLLINKEILVSKRRELTLKAISSLGL